MEKTYDFVGWATKNNLKCADGRVIRHNAFKVNDGKRVPLVWNHQHNSVGDVLGHALLENRDEGVYAYCTFNNTAAGQDAKECVKHGDVESLSIWANNLDQVGSDVLHGVIREVSLVLAGANPGAFVESVMAHGEPMGYDDEEGIFYTGDGIILEHSIDNVKKDDPKKEDDSKKGEPKEEPEKDKSGKTVKDVMNTLNDDQKKAVAIVVDQIIKDNKSGPNNKEEKEEMKHNIFDTERNASGSGYLSHSDVKTILDTAKRSGNGTLRDVVNAEFEDGGILAHSIPTDGMIGPSASTADQTYGFRDPDMLFPEYKDINSGAPEWRSRDMDWVHTVMSGVRRSPFARVKTQFADITEDAARAKGYIKGKQKKEEVFTLLKRTTDPQTIYKKQKLDRDDIIDITDFDVVAWIKSEMRVMLNEEIARAILIGDGRQADDDDKIQEAHVRPIVTDVDLFNVKVPVTPIQDEDFAKTTINSVIKARKNYKGSGNPTFFTTEDVLTDMLLLEDGIGHKLYKTVGELATALRVSSIVTVEAMEGYNVSVSSNEYPLIGVIVNLRDYNVGADKGGDINLFDDFDIDFNQYKYLMETRISGALIKPFSALTVYKNAQG